MQVIQHSRCGILFHGRGSPDVEEMRVFTSLNWCTSSSLELDGGYSIYLCDLFANQISFKVQLTDSSGSVSHQKIISEN